LVVNLFGTEVRIPKPKLFWYDEDTMKVPKVVREWYRKLGAKGGSVTSPEKAAAVRANGRLGGRPKGSKNKKAKP
jgi:hypothetical protein